MTFNQSTEFVLSDVLHQIFVVQFEIRYVFRTIPSSASLFLLRLLFIIVSVRLVNIFFLAGCIYTVFGAKFQLVAVFEHKASALARMLTLHSQPSMIDLVSVCALQREKRGRWLSSGHLKLLRLPLHQELSHSLLIDAKRKEHFARRVDAAGHTWKFVRDFFAKTNDAIIMQDYCHEDEQKT